MLFGWRASSVHGCRGIRCEKLNPKSVCNHLACIMYRFESVKDLCVSYTVTESLIGYIALLSLDCFLTLSIKHFCLIRIKILFAIDLNVSRFYNADQMLKRRARDRFTTTHVSYLIWFGRRFVCVCVCFCLHYLYNSILCMQFFS